jgi:hypothetical protein
MQLETVEDYIDQGLVHSIHTSERRSHRGCRLRHHWVFVDGYYPTTTAKPLEFGVAFHVAMERLYDPSTWKDPELRAALALSAFTQTIEQQYRTFCAKNPEKVTPEVREDYTERKALGLGMLKYYIKMVMPKYDNNFTPVKVEIPFEVPIYGPNKEVIWCKCDRCFKRWQSHPIGAKHHDEWQVVQYNHLRDEAGFSAENAHKASTDQEYYRAQYWKGLPVTYGGRFDMLAQDELDRYWIFDWKTAARLSNGEPGANDDYLWLDDQITSYCWAMWSIGVPIAGFVYAEIKKAVPDEPEPLAKMYKGRLYSCNKMNATTYELFYNTVAEGDPGGLARGAYDEYLEYLQHDGERAFHLRHQITRSEEELRNAGVDLYNEARVITDAAQPVYPSPGRFGCTTCAFQEPCLGRRRGEDYHYTLSTLYDKKERHYFEKPASTDSKGGE